MGGIPLFLGSGMHPTYRPSGRGEAGPGDDEGHGDGPEGGNEWSEEVVGVVCWVGWNYCFPTHVGRLSRLFERGFRDLLVSVSCLTAESFSGFGAKWEGFLKTTQNLASHPTFLSSHPSVKNNCNI